MCGVGVGSSPVDDPRSVQPPGYRMGLRVHEPTRARVGDAVRAYGPEAGSRLAERRRELQARATSALSSRTALPPRGSPSQVGAAAESGDGPPDDLPRLLEMVRAFPLLSIEVTVDQAKRVRAGAEAAHQPHQAEIPISQRKLERIVSSGAAAKDCLIHHNLRLVLTLARRYSWSGLPLVDRFQHGVAGLIRAVEKYDHRLGYRLSTYATWWIHQSIIRGIHQESSTIRLPSHVWDQVRTLSKVERSLAIHGNPIDASSLATATGWSSSQVAKVQGARSTSRVELLDPIDLRKAVDGAFSEPDIAEAVTDALFAGLVAGTIGYLRERERRIVSLRFGLDDDYERTLEQIGREVGLTRERVRQIVRDSLEQLEVQLSPLLQGTSWERRSSAELETDGESRSTG